MTAAKWAGLAVLGLAAVLALALRVDGPAPILLENAVATPMGEGFAVTLKITNGGGPDRLLGASSDAAEGVSFMGAGAGPAFAIPAGATPSLAMDGAHIMLSGLRGDTTEGRLVAVTLDFEAAGPLTTRARLAAPTMGMEHGDGDGDGGEPLEGGMPTLAVSPQGEGYRVVLSAPGLTLTSEGVDGPHSPGAGHGHLYLDGLKLQRIYAPEASIGALPPGRYELSVSLNTHDHRPYLVDGAPALARTLLEVR